MPDQNVKVEIGQIWKHNSDPKSEFHIHTIKPSPYPGEMDVSVVLIYQNRNGRTRIGRPDFFGRCLPDGTPRWSMAGWKIVPAKKFTPVSPKFLKRRMRDQLAQQVLVGANDPSPNGNKT